MTGRGVDQILPHPSRPQLHEPLVTSAIEYVAFAEQTHGAIPRPVDCAYVWGVVPELLQRQRPDVRIVNLETSITTCEDAAFKGINYRMHPGNVGVLTAAQIDVCVLANNHVLDWGPDGLLETLRTLSAANIRVAGAGHDLATAQAPAVFPVGQGSRVLVFSFGARDAGIPTTWAADAATPGVNLLADLSVRTVEQIARLVQRAKRPDDIAVASLHWGANWGFDIPPAHRTFAHALIDRASIDVVYGHSSHHPKAIEVYRDRPIIYGCGDFLNDYEGIGGYSRFRGDLVLMYFPTMDVATHKLVRLTMTPLQIRNFRLNHPTRSDRKWLRESLDRECFRFGHRITPSDTGFTLAWT